jgi:hypothetical protein|tara:strand:+ start:971 stop:1156 length:186 start_codon:yes stop_codon:yes gene_type:complete
MSKTYRRNKRYFDDDSNVDDPQISYRKEKSQEYRKSRTQIYEVDDNEEGASQKNENSIRRR